MMAALAALNTCLCDPGGPIRRRVPVLLSFTVLGALIVAGVGLARGGGIAVALPLGVFGLFCATFVRIYGEAAQQVGILLGIMLVLALDRPLTGVAEAGTLAAAFIGGCLWATLLTLVIWRIRPYLPAARAVAAAYRALAAAAAGLRALLLAGHTGESVLAPYAKTHLGEVRIAIEAARGIVMDTLRGRGGAGNRGQHGLIRLEVSDQLLAALIALGESLEHAEASERATVARLLRRLRPMLLVYAESIVSGSTKANRQIARAIDAMAEDAASLPKSGALQAVADRIVERLRMAYTLAVPANFLPGAGLDGTPPDPRQRLLQPLRANLAWQSLPLRHALRLSAAAAPALAFTMLWFTPFDHWLTITIVMTMQPYFGATYTRVLQRVAGTVAGGLVAALVGVICSTPVALAIAMFPLAMITLAARSLAYGLFVVWLTPLIVLIVDIGQPGADEWLVAGLRALFTVVGGAVAVAACFVMWPNFEPRRLAQQIQDAIAAQGRYAAAVLSQLVGQDSDAVAERARREAGIALNELEASISRALAEPAGRSPPVLDAAMTIDALLRRNAGRSTAIMLDPTTAAALPPSAWQAWRDWIARSSLALAAGATQLEARPVPANESVARMARQFELIAGALQQAERSQPNMPTVIASEAKRSP
jgi:uncharacterized membrane protein YccC